MRANQPFHALAPSTFDRLQQNASCQRPSTSTPHRLPTMNGSKSRACLYWINALIITIGILVIGFASYAHVTTTKPSAVWRAG